jgi:hypothetical protein
MVVAANTAIRLTLAIATTANCFLMRSREPLTQRPEATPVRVVARPGLLPGLRSALRPYGQRKCSKRTPIVKIFHRQSGGSDFPRRPEVPLPGQLARTTSWSHGSPEGPGLSGLTGAMDVRPASRSLPSSGVAEVH